MAATPVHMVPRVWASCATGCCAIRARTRLRRWGRDGCHGKPRRRPGPSARAVRE
jgi:hypothetical protein